MASERELSTAMRILIDQIKELRAEHDLTQQELADKMIVARSTVATAETLGASSDFCERLDEVFPTNGKFSRMRDTIGAEDARSRVAGLARVEANATAIRAYSPLHVPGLMQTRAYMELQFGTARFSGATDADIEQLVETRLARQGVLDKLRSYLVILDEAILRRATGSRELAREQFEHILELAHRPRITVLVIPFSVVAHPAAGPMVLFDLETGGRAVHLDNPVSGTTSTDSGIVQACNEQFEMVRSQAASVPDSSAMIKDRLRELQ